MKGKKISTRTLRLRGVGLIVTCTFGLLGAFPPGAQQKRDMEDRMATLTKPSNQADIPKIGYIRNVSKPTSVDEHFGGNCSTWVTFAIITSSLRNDLPVATQQH
jgi:hypothetical protein